MHVERIVKTAPDPWNPSGPERVVAVTERYTYTPREAALLKSTWAFKRASLAASALLQTTMVMVERGETVMVDGQRVAVTAEAAGAVAKELARRVGYATVHPLVKAGVFAGDLPETVERTVPVEQSAHAQPGAEDLPHLDEERLQKLPTLAPATVSDDVSKVAKMLSDGGWEPIESTDSFEHFVKADVGELILAPDGFALKSQWTGDTVMGDSVPDLEAALDAVEE